MTFADSDKPGRAGSDKECLISHLISYQLTRIAEQ